MQICKSYNYTQKKCLTKIWESVVSEADILFWYFLFICVRSKTNLNAIQVWPKSNHLWLYSGGDKFKGLNLADRMLEEIWTEVCNIVQEAVTKTIFKKKKHKKAKWLSEEALQIAEKRKEEKGSGNKKGKDVPTWMQLSVSCSILSNSLPPMNCSPPGPSVHGVLLARLLKLVAISFSRRSSQPRD